MSDRTPCIVPFCGRTKKRAFESEEFICGNHWPLTDKALRRTYHKVKRKDPFIALETWNRLKAQAIERAAGLEG